MSWLSRLNPRGPVSRPGISTAPSSPCTADPETCLMVFENHWRQVSCAVHLFSWRVVECLWWSIVHVLVILYSLGIRFVLLLCCSNGLIHFESINTLYTECVWCSWSSSNKGSHVHTTPPWLCLSVLPITKTCTIPPKWQLGIGLGNEAILNWGWQ